MILPRAPLPLRARPTPVRWYANIASGQKNFDLAFDLWNKGDIAGAEERYRVGLKEHPTADAWYNHGNCLLSLGKNFSCPSCVETLPLTRGLTKGRPDESVASFERSIALDSSRSDAHVNLANVHALKKRYEQAIQSYQNALLLEPDDGETRFNYGCVLDASGKLEEALEQYKIAVEKGVKAAEANYRNAGARLLAKRAKGE
ncbi:hypothetical protein HK101_008159 [Irineochytrium annulatum]|nr:hypothetical protein HK101_008159 [Irineochytrium annulatum]